MKLAYGLFVFSFFLLPSPLHLVFFEALDAFVDKLSWQEWKRRSGKKVTWLHSKRIFLSPDSSACRLSSVAGCELTSCAAPCSAMHTYAMAQNRSTGWSPSQSTAKRFRNTTPDKTTGVTGSVKTAGMPSSSPSNPAYAAVILLVHDAPFRDDAYTLP